MNTYRRRKSLSDINVVPYIDVMLVLLIIFMVTTPLLTQGVNIDLPQAKTKTIDHLSQEPIIVSVDAQGQYFLNLADHPTKPINPHDLLIRISAELTLDQQAHQTRQVLVKGDKSANYGQIITAMALLQHAGATHVGLITKDPT